MPLVETRTIFDEPRFLPAGDRYLLIEFSDTISIRVNLVALELSARLEAERIPGVVETLPIFASLLVHYDCAVCSFGDVVAFCRALWEEIGDLQNMLVPSRLIEIPVCYLDPWTRACVDDYRDRIGPIQDNPEFVVESNGLADTAELVRNHSATQHWVGGVGFYPGLPDLIPLDPRSALSVEKYDPPRVWTVEGAIGVGGGFTSIYPMRTPGGYHLIGRTPVPIFDLERRFDAFEDSPALFRPGDRVKFVPIDVKAFKELERRIGNGSYVYNITNYERFDLCGYEEWLAGIDPRRRF